MREDSYRVDGRVAIITGGTEGIGKATATLLALRGAAIVIAGRTEAKLRDTAAEIAVATGARCIGVQTDARDEEQVNHLVARTIEAFGRVDILVNNVGWSERSPLRTLDTAGWRQEFGLNLDPAFFGSRAVFEHFRAQGGGAIVNTSSVAGIDGIQGLAAYSAAKCALQMFTRVASAEWGPHGIRVNAVAPGLIATENALRDFEESQLDVDGICASRPLRRAGRPQEVANAIAFLASDAASYISGETIQVTGGPVVNGSAD